MKFPVSTIVLLCGVALTAASHICGMEKQKSPLKLTSQDICGPIGSNSDGDGLTARASTTISFVPGVSDDEVYTNSKLYFDQRLESQDVNLSENLFCFKRAEQNSSDSYTKALHFTSVGFGGMLCGYQEVEDMRGQLRKTNGEIMINKVGVASLKNDGSSAISTYRDHQTSLKLTHKQAEMIVKAYDAAIKGHEESKKQDQVILQQPSFLSNLKNIFTKKMVYVGFSAVVAYTLFKFLRK